MTESNQPTSPKRDFETLYDYDHKVFPSLFFKYLVRPVPLDHKFWNTILVWKFLSQDFFDFYYDPGLFSQNI